MGTIDVLGPTIQYVTSPAETGGPCVMRGTIPAGVSIPLHSHGDPDTFVMLSGSVEGLVYLDRDFEWVGLCWRHLPRTAECQTCVAKYRRSTAAMIIVSTSKLGRFLQELGKPLRQAAGTASPTRDEIARFLQTAERYGYWNATPEENARVGIAVPNTP